MIKTKKESKEFINKGMEGISPISCRTDLLENRINELIRELRDDYDFIVHDDINLDPMLKFQNLDGGRPIHEVKIVTDPHDGKKYFKFSYLQFN